MRKGTHSILYEKALDTTVIDLDNTSLENIKLNPIDVDVIKASSLELQISIIDCNQVRIDYEYDGKKAFVIHDFAAAQELVNINQLIPNCDNIDINIDKNGSININSCDPYVNLNLTTVANITNSADFSCKNLNLIGNSILLEHNVKVGGNATLTYQESLLNKQKLVVKNNLIFAGSNKGSLINDGDIYANGQIKFNQDAHHMPVYHAAREVVNNGTIYSGGELTINAKQLFNNNIILSPQKIHGFGKKFINLGYVISEQNIHFGYSDYIINEKSAIICSQKNINLLKIDLQHAIDVDELPPASNLINQGKIQAGGNLRIHNLEGIVANEISGSLVAKDLFLGGDEFINNGTVNGDCLEVTLSDNGSRWYNNATGKVSTRELKYSAQQLINQGSIYTQQQHNGLLTKTLINKSSGQIVSDANIKLQALKAIINDCLMQAAEQLILHSNYINVNVDGKLLANHIDLDSGNCEVHGAVDAKQACNLISEILDNFMGGKITAKDLTLTTERLQNAGKITAKTAKVLSAKSITNSASGIITVDQKLNARAVVINNAGLISTEQGTINLWAINNFNQQAYAKIMANLLNIASSKVKLSGEIAAKVAIVLDVAEAVVKQDGKVTTADTLQFAGKRLFNAGNCSAKQKLCVDVQEKILQAATGSMESAQGTINTGILENEGVLSFGILNLTADLLKNLYNAIIESAASMTLAASELENAGIIEAYGQLQLKIMGCLNNLAHGHINTLQDLLIDAGSILKNAGFINADARALIKLSDSLTNEATGVITAKTFDLKGGWKVNNYGKILAQSKLQIDIGEAINNYQSGTISSEEALQLISSNLNNSGQITANHLELSLQNILNNYQTGNIEASHALNLVGAKLILNAGEITSARDLNITATEVLENLKNGKLTAQASLQLIEGLLVENNGLVAANRLKLAASHLLLNGELHSKQLDASAKAIVGDGVIDGVAIDLTTDLVRFDGKLIASSLNIEARNYLQLLKNGSITCTAASKLITQAGFVNLGKLLHHNKLAVIAQDIFHDREANLTAEGELYIKAINAYLDGDVQGSQNLFLLVANQFEYNTAKLTANGELHLTLKDGSQVKQNINTAGDLKIEFLTNTGVWYNEQQLTAGGELTLDVPGVIFVNGKSSKQAMLWAKNNINFYGQGLDTGCGQIQAGKLNAHTASDIKLNKDSTIDVNSVLAHSNEGKIDQQTPLKSTGDVELLATQCEPIIYAMADATGAIKQFKPNFVTNADGADALAVIYKLAGTKEVGWAARIKASQQLKEHINDPIVRKLVMAEVRAVLLSADDLYSLATIGFKLTAEEIELLRYYKLANISSTLDTEDAELLEEELSALVASKLLTYIESSIEKSKFWFGLAAGSSGIMGAIGHINHINFNVFTDNTNDNPQKTNITKLCTQNDRLDTPIHNIYVTATKPDCYEFAVLTEVIANQNPAKSTINVEQPIAAKKVRVLADGKITITSQIEAEANNLIESLCADVEIKSLKARSGNHENFDDYILSQARVAAGKLLSIKGVNIILQKAETASGEAGTYIQALANILDVPVDLVRQRVQHFYEKRKSGHIRDTYLTQHTSLHQSKGNFNSVAGNSSSYYAPTIEAQEATIASTNETTLFADVHDRHEHHEDIRGKKRRWYGGSKKTHSQSSSARVTSKGTRFKVKKLKVSGANVELRHVHSSADHNLFSAPNGKVAILQGENRIASVHVFTSSEPLWQKQSSRQENHTTYSASTFTGTIEIDAKSAEIEVVCGRVLDFLQQITLKPEDTIYKTLYEHHEVHAESQEGPGAALIALVALAVTLATQGAASGWAASLCGASSGFTHAAITAGFQSIMAQAASTIVANNGDLDKALKDLCKKDTLKKLATAMLSAGLMDKAASGLNLPKTAITRSMPQNVVYNFTKATLDAGLAAGISGKDFDQALQDNLINAVFATLGNKIDLLHGSESNNTLLHAMLGGVRGTVNKDGWLVGMIDSIISARLPKYIEKLKLKRQLREQLNPKLKTQPRGVQNKFKTDASGRFIYGEQIFSGPEFINAIINEGKILSGNRLSQDELSIAIHEQLKLFDLNELGNIGKGLYNSDADFRKYVNHRTEINNQAINQGTAIPLKDGLELQPVNLVNTIVGVAILGSLAVAYMATRVSPDKTWSKLPAFEQNNDLDLDTMNLKISQHTLAAKKHMQDTAAILTDQYQHPDLCDYLRNLGSQRQAQHFTDVGYGIFQYVKELYPLAYKTKYQETGDGIGVHAATTMYGKAAVRSCEMEEWVFEKSAKDGKIDGEGKAKVAGKPGSVRHDMLYRYKATTPAQSKTETYDIKTGNAKITKNEAAKKVASLPKKPDPRVYEVRPNGVYPTEIIVDQETKSYQSPKANP